MRNGYDDRFWAENHQVMSDDIAHGLQRLGGALAGLFRRLRGLVAPDSSEEARKRSYCIG